MVSTRVPSSSDGASVHPYLPVVASSNEAAAKKERDLLRRTPFLGFHSPLTVTALTDGDDEGAGPAAAAQVMWL